MKRRVGGSGGAPTDLLVCFPSRAHLTLMPKPICSPSRTAEAGKRHQARSGTRGQVSPLFRTKSKSMSSEIAEPTSPKVTCAGQIKVRPKSRTRPPPSGGGDKNWLSVVEQIERLHKQRKRAHWLDTGSLKKDIMHVIGALRGLRFNMRCFGAFQGPVDCITDEEDGEGCEEEQEEEEAETSTASRTMFSKWFMLVEENQGTGCKKEGKEEVQEEEDEDEEEEEEEEEEEAERDECKAPPSSAPPPNALLLMRCRSAPAKGWLKRSGEEETEDEAGEEVTAQMTKEEEKDKERLVLMSYAPDFFKISTDIAKETWVVGSMDPLARSRSWRR
ncbi:unnamed protein product [Musa acuminata subsp. burmannicoides]